MSSYCLLPHPAYQIVLARQDLIRAQQEEGDPAEHKHAFQDEGKEKGWLYGKNTIDLKSS